MKPGDDAPFAAKRLTLDIYRMLRGETAAESAFNQPIHYSKLGVA
jgi:hypothetical protein